MVSRLRPNYNFTEWNTVYATCEENNDVVDAICINDLRHEVGGRHLLPAGGDQAARHYQPEHRHPGAFQELTVGGS